MRALENLAIAFFDGLTGIFDSLHEKLLARRTKKQGGSTVKGNGNHIITGNGNRVSNDTGRSEPVLSKDQWAQIHELEALDRSMEARIKRLQKWLPDPETSKALEIFKGLGITEPAPWLKLAATFAASGMTKEQAQVFCRITASGAITKADLHLLQDRGIQVTFTTGGAGETPAN